METQDKCKLQQIGVSIRDFNLDLDYNDVKGWFEHFSSRGIGCPSRDMLSLKGLIVENNNQKICAGWLYTTNSNIAMIEFVIANYEAPREIRKQSLKKLLTALEAKAINSGYEILLVLTSNLRFSESLESNGYTRGKVPHYENIKILWQQDY